MQKKLLQKELSEKSRHGQESGLSSSTPLREVDSKRLSASKNTVGGRNPVTYEHLGPRD